MKRLLLYFLLILLLAAVGTFSYGFWNGKKVREFSSKISEIQEKHNLTERIEKVETGFQENSKEEASQVKDDSQQFLAELKAIGQEAKAAKKEIEDLEAPREAESAKNLAEEYYLKLAQEADDLEGIISYTSQMVEAASFFEEIKENSSLDELKNLIGLSREKTSAIEIDSLPPALQEEAQNLKDSMNSFLLRLEDMVALRSENTAEVEASYANFSQKESEFFRNAKKYIGEMENLKGIEERIKADIERLEKVKFSLR
jgi:succinate dehydrogenase/fumarate reductase flavoprotein subunit